MKRTEMPNRQIHLDFHTSGLIEGVGADFDPDEFAQTLKDADVEGICVFSRCHHGYCYHPTKVGVPHPHLDGRDLLGMQLAALKKAGITAGLYTTICWDEVSAQAHPEWLALNTENQQPKVNPHTGDQMGPFQPGWRFLCWNTPYRDYVKEHVQELVANYDGAFLFLDILVQIMPCVCTCCVDRMKDQGLDPEKPADQLKHTLESAREFMAFINAAVEEKKPGLATFYNSRLRLAGRIEDGPCPEMEHLGYLAIESLPSGAWGYNHFPLNARYYQNFKKPIMGHTGKFQKSWGDFGGLKNQAALDYEVIRMMAHGVAAGVGDQLPPRGKLDKPTYDLIGRSFSKVKDVEDVLIPSDPIDEIGVLLTNKPISANLWESSLEAETGAMKMLMQLQYQYSFIDEQSDFGSYKLIILPDNVTIIPSLKKKLDAYLSKGGKLLITNASGLDEKGKWAIDQMKINVKGDNEFVPYYIYPTSTLKDESVIEDTDYVHYLGGKDVKVLDDGYEVLAKITQPYFNRSWDHFCSHFQSPPESRTESPELVYNGKNVAYFASPVFTCYQQFAPRFVKQMADWTIKKLLGDKMIESNLPSTAEVICRKSTEGQKVISILHYVPQRRGDNLDIVEDVIPLTDVEISVLLDGKCEKVIDKKTGQPIGFTIKNGRANLRIPRIDGFKIITL